MSRAGLVDTVQRGTLGLFLTAVMTHCTSKDPSQTDYLEGFCVNSSLGSCSLIFLDLSSVKTKMIDLDEDR